MSLLNRAKLYRVLTTINMLIVSKRFYGQSMKCGMAFVKEMT